MRPKNRGAACVLLVLLLGSQRGIGNESAGQIGPEPGLTPEGMREIGLLRQIPIPPVGWSRQALLLPGQTHRYVLPLAAGHFLHVAVRQAGIDVEARVRYPKQPALLEIDSPIGAQGPDDLFFLAPANGRYLLEVVGPKVQGPAALGTYEIRIAASRPATPRDVDYARTAGRYARARQLRDEGSYGEAVKLLAETAVAWARLGEPDQEISSLLQRIKLFKQVPPSQPERLAVLGRALTLCRNSGLAHPHATVLSHLGQIEKQRSDFAAASRYYEQAISLFETVRASKDAAIRRNDLALVRNRQRRFDEAIELYGRAIRELAPLGELEDLANTRTNLGVLHFRLGQLSRAKEQLERALQLYHRTGNLPQKAKVLSWLGELKLWLEGPAAARPDLERALALREALKDQRGKAVTLVGIGLLRSKEDRPHEAVRALEQAEVLFREWGSEGDKAVTYHSLGDVHERMGELDRARSYYERALPLARSSDRPWTVAALELVLARLDRRQGRLAQALSRLEDLASSATLWRDRELGQQHNELHVEVLAALHFSYPLAGFDSRAFAVSESGRAQRFRALLARSPRTPEELARLEDVSRQIRSHPRVQTASWTSMEQGLEGTSELEDLFDVLLNRPGSAPPALTLEEVQDRILDDETLLLEYHLGDARSFLWAVSRHDRHLVALPGRRQLEEAARRWLQFFDNGYQALAEPGSVEAARDLAGILLYPVAGQLEKRRIVVVAPEILQSVPFHALPHPLSGALLITDHQVVSEPSISLLAQLRQQERQQASRKLAVVADPVFGEDDERLLRAQRGRRTALPRHGHDDTSLPRLPHTKLEADTLIKLAGADPEDDAVFGLRATPERVLQGWLRDYHIVHFATHGLYDDQFPELSSLALSNYDPSGRPLDGRLRAFEIFNLKLRADLVVLSACRTAWDEEYGNEGRAGLVQGFLHAGASSVVASLWDVDDEATATLMSHFYQGLLHGRLPPAEALRQAQLRIRQEKGWESPYFWAGFVLQGDWQ